MICNSCSHRFDHHPGGWGSPDTTCPKCGFESLDHGATRHGKPLAAREISSLAVVADEIHGLRKHATAIDKEIIKLNASIIALKDQAFDIAFNSVRPGAGRDVPDSARPWDLLVRLLFRVEELEKLKVRDRQELNQAVLADLD